MKTGLLALGAAFVLSAVPVASAGEMVEEHRETIEKKSMKIETVPQSPTTTLQRKTTVEEEEHTTTRQQVPSPPDKVIEKRTTIETPPPARERTVETYDKRE